MTISIRVAGLSLAILLGASGAVGCGEDAGGGGGSGGSAEVGAGGEAVAEGGAGEAAEGGASEADEPTVGGDGAGDAGAPPALGLLDRLDHLGARTDLEPRSTDADGKLLPEGYHPLRTQFATIDPRQEVFFSGPRFNAFREGILDDGFDGVFEPRLEPKFTPWQTATYRAAVTGDFDGDGVDEVVCVFYDEAAKQLKAKVIRGPRGAALAFDEEPITLVEVPTPSAMNPTWFQHSVAAGNADDDPADELWVGFYNLYLFDDLDHDLQERHRESYGTTNISVTTGDFDANVGDTTDEFFVMYTVLPANVQHYQVFDGLEPQFEADGRILRPTLTDASNSQIAFQHGFAVAGEFDGDDLQQEIAILSGDAHAWRLLLMDDARVDYRTFDSMLIDLSNDDDGQPSVLAAADIDGDGVDELAADHWILDKLEDLPASSDRSKTEDRLQLDKIPRIDLPFAYQVRGGAAIAPDYGVPQRPQARQFVVLEYDDPPCNAFCIPQLDPPPRSRLRFSVRNPTAGNQLTWVDLAPWSEAARPGDALAVGNVDDDSPIVRFTGEHELLYAEPELLVALAAPPFYADSDNQTKQSYSSFGKGKADAAERSSSVAFSVGFSIGYENKDPFGNGGGFKLSVSREVDSFAKKRLSLSNWVTYATGAEDSVVFTVVPFDVYYYEIVSSPHPDEIGNELTINLPRKPQTLLASAPYFDQFVDGTRKTAPLFATHVVGDPHSYSSVAERDELCRGYCYRSVEASVGQGTGWAQVDIMETETNSKGTSYRLSVDVESEASLFGVTAGRSVGFSYGYGLEVSTEATTIFTGRVGAVEDLTPDTAYDFGLFAYKRVHPTSTKPVLVVDYWVTH